MVYDLMDTSCAEDGEPSIAPEGIPAEKRSSVSLLSNQPCSELSLTLLRHPKREVACRLESEENYVAQAFERFWQATAFNQRVEFSTLAAALQYLRASLNGTILDMLRAYARPREISLPGPGEPGEPLVEDSSDHSEVWDILHMILSDPREQRLAYLLFHCGLKPREIVHFCSQEWGDVQEIYRLRRNIMERLLRNADYLRWQLS